MAGDWIKMNKSLPRDPRVVRISSALKADRLRTVGGLLSAWCLFDEQTANGKLDGYTPELLDEIIGITGLADAMISVGWLEFDGESLQVPRFEEHNGQSAKRRAQDSSRKLSARKADICPPAKRTKSVLEKRREEKSVITLTSNNKARGSMDELKAYAVGLGMPASDGESMFDHWESNGWRNGSSATKDWQAGMRKWKSQGWLPSQKAAAKQQPAHRQRGYQENLELP
jgi:hypothetical protein